MPDEVLIAEVTRDAEVEAAALAEIGIENAIAVVVLEAHRGKSIVSVITAIHLLLLLLAFLLLPPPLTPPANPAIRLITRKSPLSNPS